jgi:hypothetical protein
VPEAARSPPQARQNRARAGLSSPHCAQIGMRSSYVKWRLVV